MEEDKLKKFRKKYHCIRCNFLCDNKQELENHQETNHGIFSKEKHIEYNKGDTQVKRLYLECLGDKPIEKSTKKKQEIKKYVRPEVSPDEIKWIQPYNDGSYDVVCKNCLSITHTTRKPNPKQDLLLCGFCGMNLHRDNREKIHDWLHNPKHPERKLHKTNRLDVVMSAIPQLNSEVEIKRILI